MEWKDWNIDIETGECILSLLLQRNIADRYYCKENVYPTTRLVVSKCRRS